MVARGVSERLACRAVSLQRSSYRYHAAPQRTAQPSDQVLREQLVALAHQHRRFGYRRVGALLRRQGEVVNHKRVWRVWQQAGLSLPRRRPKKRRAVSAASATQPTKAAQRGQVWSYDFIFDWTERSDQLKMLVVLDEYSRECHAIKVGLTLNSSHVKTLLAELFARHGAPGYLRSDNGGEFIAAELEQWLREMGVQTLHIAPGAPWENAYTESFNGKFRDECLNQEVFWHERHAQVAVEDWRRWYEQERPHSALGYRTPKEAAAQTLAGVKAASTATKTNNKSG